MAQKTTGLSDIRETLDSLQTKVQELTTQEPAPRSPERESDSQRDRKTESGADCPTTDCGVDQGQLLAGIGALATFSKLKDFPEYFAKLAESSGLRMLLLKRWNSGLQVFVTKNISMPAEAKRKRSDGRAPIPFQKNDIFEAAGSDASVYAGPVPVKHFPIDLTLMLGRGSRDRQIVILPLPSQNHWNTFLYFDADQGNEAALYTAEILAHFALVRMCLLNKGVKPPQGRVSAILEAELQRRRTVATQKAASRADTTDSAPVTPPTDDVRRDLAEMDLDPFAVNEPEVPIAPQPNSRSEKKAEPAVRDQAEPADEPKPVAAADPGETVNSSEELLSLEGKVTPESILRHSGELPALPKAACHIMAVIEDPRTTATRLEKALAMDQTLTAKVLRIANSPFYGAVREIRTVSESIVRLGFVTIRNWTLVTATRSIFLAPGAGRLYQKIWKQSVLSAMAGQLVAQAVGGRDAEAVFIGGLMQNIGQLVLARWNPELFQEILMDCEDSGLPYHEVERRLLGFDHGELGAILIREWNLSQDLEEAVRWHHAFADPEARNTRDAAMIALGEEIAWSSQEENIGETNSTPEDGPGGGPAPDNGDLPPLSEAARFLGISPAKVADLKVQAAELRIDPHFFT